MIFPSRKTAMLYQQMPNNNGSNYTVNTGACACLNSALTSDWSIFPSGLTPEASLQGLIQPQSSSQVSVLLKNSQAGRATASFHILKQIQDQWDSRGGEQNHQDRDRSTLVDLYTQPVCFYSSFRWHVLIHSPVQLKVLSNRDPDMPLQWVESFWQGWDVSGITKRWKRSSYRRTTGDKCPHKYIIYVDSARKDEKEVVVCVW